MSEGGSENATKASAVYDSTAATVVVSLGAGGPGIGRRAARPPRPKNRRIRAWPDLPPARRIAVAQRHRGSALVSSLIGGAWLAEDEFRLERDYDLATLPVLKLHGAAALHLGAVNEVVLHLEITFTEVESLRCCISRIARYCWKRLRCCCGHLFDPLCPRLLPGVAIIGAAGQAGLRRTPAGLEGAKPASVSAAHRTVVLTVLGGLVTIRTARSTLSFHCSSGIPIEVTPINT